eukprot:snap_masked-scaffold_6-processed-gene-1.23-mRNA-1 protein AED:1.00 eAED:1.00 QI:0/-1/0/0/-1/1/1/0/551
MFGMVEFDYWFVLHALGFLYVVKLMKMLLLYGYNTTRLSILWKNLPGTLNPIFYIQKLRNIRSSFIFQKETLEKYPGADFIKVANGPSPEIVICSRDAYEFLFYQKEHLTNGPDTKWYKPFEVFTEFVGTRSIAIMRNSKRFPRERHYWIKQVEILKKILPSMSKIVPGSFHFESIWRQIDIETNNILKNIKKRKRLGDDGRKINILLSVNHFAETNIKQLIFGDVIDKLDFESPDKDFVEMFNRTQDSIAQAVGFRMLISLFSSFLPFPLSTFLDIYGNQYGSINASYRENVQEMKEYAKRGIKYTRKLSFEELDRRVDLCSVFLRDTVWDDELLLGLMFSLCVAGRNVISGLLSWTLYFLADNTHVQHQLYKELVEYMNKQGLKSLKEITASELDALPYLNGVIREAGRMNPPLFQGIVEAAVDLQWVDGTQFPKGTKFSYYPYAYGNLAENFQDPTKFEPCRWIKDGKAITTEQDPFIMFQHRNRTCLGMSFGLFQAKAYIANIVLNFRFGIEDLDKRDITKAVGIHLLMANKAPKDIQELLLYISPR